ITAYNVYAEAVNKHGYLGEVYGLPRHLFREEHIERWAEERGVLVKAIEDIALGTASVYRQLEVPLPAKLPYGDRKTLEVFADLVAKIMPFDLVIDEQTADGREARVSRSSVCGSWGAIAGTLRYFADRFGHYWRRSGGQLSQAGGEGTSEQIAAQLASVSSWDEFIGTRIVLDPDAAIPERERHRLDSLPSSVFLYGDRVPVDYDVEQGVGGIVRLRLKEGQARRLHPKDLPAFDRPVRYTVTRGKHEAVRASSLDELRSGLRTLESAHRARLMRAGRRGRRRRR